MACARVFIDLVDSDDDNKTASTSMSTFSTNAAVIAVEKPAVKEAKSCKKKRCRDSEVRIDLDQEQPELSTTAKPKRHEKELARTDSECDTSHTCKAGKQNSTKLRVPQNEVTKAPLHTPYKRALPMIVPPSLASAGPYSLRANLRSNSASHAPAQAAPNPSDSRNSEVKDKVDNDLLSSPSFGNSCLENLLPTSQTYQQIQARLKETCPIIDVLKIERLDDPRRRRKFEGHRSFLSDAKIEPNEQQLFHGASADSIAKILRQGFNRSYAGEHGASYGLGVYFARSAGYSCRYAPPDAQGHRRMLLCDVLVGEAALGTPGMRAPPPRAAGGDPHELCDSTVDCLLRPSIYVCYHDDQAIPAHLITFRADPGCDDLQSLLASRFTASAAAAGSARLHAALHAQALAYMAAAAGRSGARAAALSSMAALSARAAGLPAASRPAPAPPAPPAAAGGAQGGSG